MQTHIRNIRHSRVNTAMSVLNAVAWTILTQRGCIQATLDTSNLKIILSANGIIVKDKRTGNEVCASREFGYCPTDSSIELRLLERGLNALIRSDKDTCSGYSLERKLSDRHLYRHWYQAFKQKIDLSFVDYV